jgi:hypothetical protein
MARLRRMYARPLFVVVGISRAFSSEGRLFKQTTVWDLTRGGYRFAPRGDQSGLFWPVFGAFRTAVLGLCLGIAGACGYTLAA